MTVIVSLSKIVDELEIVRDDRTVYLDRRTGDTIMVTDEDIRTLEAGDLEDLADWQCEHLAAVQEAIESDHYIALPSSFDIHEWDIMDRFCAALSIDTQREELARAIRGRGAFRCFHDTIRRMGIEEDWYRFRRSALESIAMNWLESRGIHYTRDVLEGHSGRA